MPAVAELDLNHMVQGLLDLISAVNFAITSLEQSKLCHYNYSSILGLSPGQTVDELKEALPTLSWP
jgi:hypothetical protein